MNDQLKSAFRSDGYDSRPVSHQAKHPAPAASVRTEVLERARRRMASGFYDSNVCLDITIRRLARSLGRPVVVVTAQGPTRLPGRSAQRAAQGRRRG